ncbi:hypothetical protein KCU83_g469, partial [Aureobasidium melanogenum]
LKKICVRMYNTTITGDLTNNQKKPLIWITLRPRRLIETSVIRFPTMAPSDTMSKLCQALANYLKSSIIILWIETRDRVTTMLVMSQPMCGGSHLRDLAGRKHGS